MSPFHAICVSKRAREASARMKSPGGPQGHAPKAHSSRFALANALAKRVRACNPPEGRRDSLKRPRRQARPGPLRRPTPRPLYRGEASEFARSIFPRSNPGKIPSRCAPFSDGGLVLYDRKSGSGASLGARDGIGTSVPKPSRRSGRCLTGKVFSRVTATITPMVGRRAVRGVAL